MNRLILLLAASTLGATTAVAQQPAQNPHAGHQMPAKKPAAKKPTAKKPAAKKAAARKAAPKKAAVKNTVTKKTAVKRPSVKKAAPKEAPAKPTADPHASHQMPVEKTTTEPQAGHEMPAKPTTADPHAGHAMPAPPANENTGHEMTAAAVEVPVGPPPAEALQGPENAGDVAWGRADMERGRAVLFTEHGDMTTSKLLIDQFETRVRNGRDGYFLNAEGWYGGDIDKLWLKTEIEGEYDRKPEQAEFQALWSHAIDPWFDVQAGVRLDAEPDTRGRLVLGIQGLAPYWIEVDAAAFLSDKGDVTARFEAEHDVRMTQKLILQPRAELDFALQDIPRERMGAGLSKADIGLRLRYQFVPNFAPYVGINYERAFGGTRRYLRAEGDDPGSLNFVVGLRTWL